MSRITLIPEEDIDDFITIVDNAYPGMKITSEEARQRFKKHLKRVIQEEKIYLYGAYREGKLAGGMLLYDFIMTFKSVKTLVGGVGLVAVDLMHKKEKVCKDMITYFLDYYKEKKACITCLYPFRPDFYKKMGFGFGTKMDHYVLTPAQLPRARKDHVQFVEKKDKNLILACYQRYTAHTHGMIEKLPSRLNRFFETPEYKIVGYKKDNIILGYVVFTFKEDEKNWILNDIHVEEFIYETREAFLELLTFLHTQNDQIRYILFSTQDEYFHHVMADPRDNSRHIIPSVYHQTNVSGVGLMYRVIGTKKVFEILKNHNFGTQDVRLKLSIKDSFYKANEGEIIIHFEKGIPHLSRTGYDVEVLMDVSDFSSLIMGVVPFERLYQYGLADISDPHYIECITNLFREEKPVCTTQF